MSCSVTTFGGSYAERSYTELRDSLDVIFSLLWILSSLRTFGEIIALLNGHLSQSLSILFSEKVPKWGLYLARMQCLLQNTRKL